MIHYGPLLTFSSLREAHHMQTTMDQLPNSELADVHLFYGMVNCNSRRVLYPNRWFGRGGPISWPARSPDMTPLDFYLWGHLKNWCTKHQFHLNKNWSVGLLKAARGLGKRQVSSNGFGNPSTGVSTHASELRDGYLSNYYNSVA